MGKASTSKKVARAAGISGGRTYRRQTPWGYFGVIVLIVILGVVGTVASRERRLSELKGQGTVPPTVGQVWNEGYGFYLCGKFADPISIKSKDPQGITTRTAGLIDIAPTTKLAAGKNATLGKFVSAVGMTLNAAELKLPGGKLYQDGDSCEGQPGHVYVMQFAYIGAPTGQLYNGDTKDHQLAKLDPRDVPLGDDELITIAFVPANKASSIPAPPSYVTQALTKFQASESTSTTTSTTVAGATSPATTVPTTATTTATTAPTTATTSTATTTTTPASTTTTKGP
jgi:hypothetical protein